MDGEQSGLSWEQLDEIFVRRLPEEELSQVRSTVRQMLRDGGGAAFWKVRDLVTGMYNQAGLLRVLEEWKLECIRSKERILLLCVDVDRLANINLVYGHSEGDVAIRNLAQMLEDILTENEVCGRLGSGEFVVAIRTAEQDTRQAYHLFRSLEKSLENYNMVSGKEYSLHALYSLWNGEIGENTDTQRALDQALSQRRRYSENQMRAMGDEADWQIDPVERRLVKEVIDRNRFRYAYQPIIDAKSGDIYAYEALMRTEEGISLSPLTILRYAELDNRLYDIEKATFFNVLEQARHFQMSSCRLFINSIPGHPLNEADYGKLRERYGDAFPNVVVEITEQEELTDENMKLLLQRSGEDGFGLAIDDYGTGYSNTSSLLRFLPNCVKMDRLLIADIQENPKKQHFVNNIITFAHENGILALAEGAETAAELKAVIQMGIDLIQGFYTARPEFELLGKLDREKHDEIVSANISLHNHIQRKVYIAGGERELSIMRLALEQYTGIVISQPEIILSGNPDYLAGMSVKIKDGCSCRITLRDVWLESIEDMPCIDIGNGAKLTLLLEGSSMLEKAGIRVPDGSSCRIEGTGNLEIHAKGIHGYGIGNDFYSGVGAITCVSSGGLTVNTDGNQCICIGGGIYRQGEGIKLLAGRIRLYVTSVEAVGIGCVEGPVPIEIRECSLDIDFRVGTGNAVGSWKSDQNIIISRTKLEINGSGSHLCGVGGIERTAGEIRFLMADIQIRITGQKVRMVGNESGGLKVLSENSGLKLIGEGNNLLGIGSGDKSARLELRSTLLEVDLRAAEPMGIGAMPEQCVYEGGARKIWINEDH